VEKGAARGGDAVTSNRSRSLGSNNALFTLLTLFTNIPGRKKRWGTINTGYRLIKQPCGSKEAYVVGKLAKQVANGNFG
jgi:hypothetical protein